MIKSELIARLMAHNPHLYEREAEGIVKAILDRITDALAAGDRVEIRDFGVFTRKECAPRRGRNPRTGAAVEVEAKANVNFRPGKGMQDRLNHRKVETGGKRRARLRTP